MGIIDQHHFDLFLLVDNLQAISEDASITDTFRTTYVAQTIANLEEYAEHHFATEEAFFKEHGDEKTLNSRKTSQLFFGDHIDRLSKNYHKQPSGKVLNEIISYVRSWLADHVLQYDKPEIMVITSKVKVDFYGHAM